MDKKRNCMRKSTGIALAALLVIAAAGIMPAAAVTLPDWNNIFVEMANGARFDYYDDDTYIINWTDTNGGLKAIHISNSPSYYPGQLTTTTSLTGNFYITDDGGRGFQDDIILLVAVNSTYPQVLNITLSATGYIWDPTGSGAAPPYAPNVVDYDDEALVPTLFTSEDYTKVSGVDVFQTWKPGVRGTGVIGDYPIFDPSNTSRLMFIDLNAGLFGNVSPRSSLEDYGNINVSYSILDNLPSGSEIVFNAYAWNNQTLKNATTMEYKYTTEGIRWTNDVDNSKTSPNGWRVFV